MTGFKIVVRWLGEGDVHDSGRLEHVDPNSSAELRLLLTKR